MLTLMTKVGATVVISGALALGGLNSGLQADSSVSGHTGTQGDLTVEGYDDLGAEDNIYSQVP